MHEAPLTGLHVLELSSGVAGPYAGRLLAMLGATVVKVEPPEGDPARWQPVDDGPQPDPSALWVHLASGKRLVSAGAVDLDAAVGWAHVVLDDRVRRTVEGGPLDPTRLAAHGLSRPVVARITAWGFDAEDPGSIADELLVQAASGLMSATGEPGRAPLRFPGWQSQYLAGGFAAASVLAVLGGGGHEVEVTWVDAALTAVEAGLASFLHQASAPPPPDGANGAQRAIQDGAFPSGAFACADGAVIPGTVRAVDWTLQCAIYGRPDLEADERFRWDRRWQHRDELRAELQPWYDARGKREIFAAALESGWAAAMVMTAGDVSTDPHLVERRFLSEVTGAVDAVVAGRPWRAAGIAEAEPVVLERAGESDRWFGDVLGRRGRRPVAPAPPAMPQVRVLELTWAWAGPFVGRFLGTLGADVVRIETGSRPDGWRTRLRWRRAGVDVPDGVDPDGYTWDAAALFNTVNRNKRSASVDLTTEGGRDAFRALLGAADVFVVNMTASVLADRGIERDVLDAVDRGLVAVTLPAVGATGPYRSMPGYGTLTEGMGGFAARFGYEDEGARVSTTYYPDDVAGLHATIAVLSGIARRAVTGEGSFVDLSQQEVMWMQVGEAIPHRALTGRDPARMGNREPGVESDVVADGEGWVALVGGRRQPVLTWSRGFSSGALEDRGIVERVEHPVTGARAALAVPVTVDGRRLVTSRAAPRFDEHTDEVLADWGGFDAGRIAALREAAAVGTTPRQPGA